MLNSVISHKFKPFHSFFYTTFSTLNSSPSSGYLQKLCTLVSTPIGGLSDLENTLNECEINLTSSLVVQVVNHCKDESCTRRLLRFFTWSCRRLGSALDDEVFNHAIRVFAEKKDHRAIDILLCDLCNEGRALDAQTFSVVAQVLVKVGREDDALGIFKNLELFKCSRDRITVEAIVNALCIKGHAKRAEGVVWHHKDKISGVELCVYRSILYGWSMQANVKEARRIIQEMKAKNIPLDLYSFNTFLRCLCEHNLQNNPSGLVPEALNVMMEMRTYKIIPNSISYNVLLSCLGRARRVKESLRIFDSMRRSGCAPDWVSYYLVARVLYLTGRFGKGNQMVDMMMEQGLVPPAKFYYDLIGVLCGVERVNYALELLDRMKKSLIGDYGPVYDVLIPKLCRGGNFEKANELWDEAEKMGISVRCSRDVLDPSKTEVFHPTKEENLKLEDVPEPHSQTQKRAIKNAMKQKNSGNKKKKGRFKKNAASA